MNEKGKWIKAIRKKYMNKKYKDGITKKKKKELLMACISKH